MEEDGRARSSSVGERGSGKHLASTAFRRARASAKSAKQRMRGMKKNTSGVNLLRKKRGSNGNIVVSPANVTLSGFMYKKRSGMTGLAASLFHQTESWTEKKFGGRLWILRYFVLQNGVIYYFDVPKHIREMEEESMRLNGVSKVIDFTPEPGSERGSIELGRYGVQVRLSYGHPNPSANTPSNESKTKAASSSNKPVVPEEEESSSTSPTLPPLEHTSSYSGDNLLGSPTPGSPNGLQTYNTGDSKSPSPYQLEILYNNMLNPKEWQSWTLCMFDKRSLFRWTSAITNIIYAPRGPSGLIMPLELDSDDELEDRELMTNSNDNLDVASPRTEDSVDDEYMSRVQLGPGGSEYEAYEDEDGETVDEWQRNDHDGNPVLKRMVQFSIPLAVSLCVANILLVARNQYVDTLSVLVLTLVCLLILFKIDQGSPLLPNGKSTTSQASPLFSSSSSSRKVVGRAIVPKPIRTRSESASQPSSSPAGGGAGGGGIPSSTDKFSPASAPSQSSREVTHKKRVGGLTVPFFPKNEVSEKNLEHCWTLSQDNLLHVRMPDYKVKKQKAPTKSAMFRTIGIDLFESEKKISQVAKKVVLPFDKCVERSRVPEPFPQLLIMNFQLPRPGGYSFSSGDGPGYNFAIYYTPSEEMLQLAQDLDQGKFVEPSIRLLKRWFAESETDQAMKERLKLAGFILNPDECGMPTWTQGFNGKPVMIKKSGSIYHDRSLRVFEMDIDLRMWGFMTRRGISALLPNALAKMEFIVSFVIQGEENDELPERAMVATQVSYLHTDKSCNLHP